MMRSPGSFPGVGIVYLFRDEFITAESAPIASPRTAEPGPGVGIIRDTANHLSISGGKLVVGGGASAIWNPLIYTDSLARVGGLAVLATITPIASRGPDAIGWLNSVTSGVEGYDGALRFIANNVQIGNPGGTGNIGTPFPYTNGVTYQVAAVLQSAGFVLALKGGDYTNWTVLWVDSSRTISPLYPAAGWFSGQSNIDKLTISSLPAPWSANYGIATNRIATTAANDTITSEANAIIEHTITAATGVTQELDVRRTDADNRWIVRMDQAGSTIKLIERNGGTETERSSAGQTWTNGASYRVVIIQAGTSIRAHVANVLKNTVTSTFNQSATGARVSHAGSNLVCWPRNLSGAALAALEAV